MQNTLKFIEDIKKEKKAVIVAHYTQSDQIKDIADYIGDSLFLAYKLTESEAKVVVSCGPNYLAENIKILFPKKIVLQSDVFSICEMIKKVDLDNLKKIIIDNPEAAVVSNIKSTAEMKAMSDICCTDTNALEIVNKLFEEKVIFFPDKNLGDYIRKRTNKNIITLDSCCPVNNAAQIKDIERLKNIYPDIIVGAHPGCKEEIVKNADFIDDFTGPIEYINKSKTKKFGIAAESGLLYKLKKENPNKKFYLLNHHLICKVMKRNNLTNVIDSLENMETAIEIDEEIRLKAENNIEKMKYYINYLNNRN
ncbi:MAG: quinolinate synthase NadA [bacterium]